ncbi:MAG: hypothetical protein HY815_23585 [Candidatus Riflebacteria bacterium]|nr:hypothetical protein [Candidatus Riflebacteria bacterium]
MADDRRAPVTGSERAAPAFLTPVFRGQRFEGHGIPLDVLPDLRVYRDLVLELAKVLFLKNNPTRRRVPKGFGDSLRLVLTELREGSAVAVLTRDVAPPEQALLPNVSKDVFADARDLINECVRAAAEGRSVPDSFPRELLGAFDGFGRHLKNDESVELRPPGEDCGPCLGFKERKQLVLLTRTDYRAEVELVGRAVAIGTDKSDFRIELDSGRVVTCPLDARSEREITAAIQDRTRLRVRVEGTGRFDRADTLGRVEQIDELETIDTLEERLRELSALPDGWLDGGGTRISPQNVEKAREILDQLLGGGVNPMPHLYPRPDGGIQAEWSFPPWEVTLALDFAVQKVVLEASDVSSDEEHEEELLFQDQALIEKLRSFLMSCRSDGQGS